MISFRTITSITTTALLILLCLAPLSVSGAFPDDENTWFDSGPDTEYNSGSSTFGRIYETSTNTSHLSLPGSDGEREKHAPGLLHRENNRSVPSSTSPLTVPPDLPRSFDWRNNNGDWTTPVKDQGEECGSCWAYAAVGLLESHLKIIQHNPNLTPDLSEQYLISCDEDDDGCDGGDFETALAYLVDTPGPDGKIGTVNESVYPVDNADDSCADLGNATRYGAGRWAYVNSSGGDDAEISLPPVNELKTAIYLKGPIAAGVDDDDAFDDYEGGIFSSTALPLEETTNHAVILVGWGNENGTEYFIGKNSFGTEWGEDGWFRIVVNSSRIGEGAVYLDEE
jgi:serine protease